MPITNAEKQARFRLKQTLEHQLKDAVDECVMNFTRAEGQTRLTASEIKRRLQESAELPNGWTKQELNSAHERLEWQRKRILKQLKSTHPKREIESEVLHLADHLISALKLSGLNESDQAEAIMITAREVGEAIVRKGYAPGQEATDYCVSSLNVPREGPTA
jgi:hypothetical protein